MGQHKKSTRYILSPIALGHSQERVEQIVSEFVDGILLSTKALSGSDEILVKGISSGKTIGGVEEQPKKQEQELPGVVNIDGWRYEKSAKWQPGKKLQLFPRESERNQPSKKPNFGWIDDDSVTFSSPEQYAKYENSKAQVITKIYNVDKDGNPGSEVKDVIEEKSIGRTIRERNPAGGLAQRAARQLRVIVDDLGKFRCPPGTPQANQFTDKLGSTCFAVSADEIRTIAEDALRLVNRSYNGFSSGGIFSLGSRGSAIPKIGRNGELQNGARWFTNGVQRMDRRTKKIAKNIEGLQKSLGLTFTAEERANNTDLVRTFEKLRELGLWDVKLVGKRDINETWSRLSRDPEILKQFKKHGINATHIQSVERAFMSKYINEFLENPEIAQHLGELRFTGLLGNGVSLTQGREAETNIINPSAKLKDLKFQVSMDVARMARYSSEDFEKVLKPGQRIGLTVEGGFSEEERAQALLDHILKAKDFENYAQVWTSIASNDPFASKGAFVGSHELSHLYQAMRFKREAIKLYGNKTASDLTGQELWDLMVRVGNDIDVDSLGVAMDKFDVVDILGGKYANDMRWKNNEVGKLELLAELRALHDSGLISGKEIDDALSWYDNDKKVRDVSLREINRTKQIESVKEAMYAIQRNNDGIADVPVSPISDGSVSRRERVSRPKSFKTETSLLSSSKKLRKQQLSLLDEGEYAAVERIGGMEVGRRDIFQLSEPSALERAVRRIDRQHRTVIDAGLEPDELSLHEASVEQQIQRTLIPTLTALDKSELQDNYTLKIPAGNSMLKSGSTQKIQGIKAHQVVHDDMALEPGVIVVETRPGTRGIFTDSGEVILPPSTIRISSIDGDGTMHAEIVDQESSMQTLERIQNEWPKKASDSAYDALLEREGMGVSRVIDAHRDDVSAGVGSRSAISILPNGKSHPVVAKRINAKNASVLADLYDNGSNPTKPQQIKKLDELWDGLTAKEKKELMDEVLSHPMVYQSSMDTAELLRKDNLKIQELSIQGTGIDPDIKEMLDTYSNEQIASVVDNVAMDLHEGFDRRVRMRMTEDGLANFFANGSISAPKLKGSRQRQQKISLLKNGINPESDTSLLPVNGYVVHSSHDSLAEDILKRQGIVPGDSPIEFESQFTPYGNVGVDGDIEILLRPEISGRTSYGLGRGNEHGTKPVWMNSIDGDEISAALIPNTKNEKTKIATVANALTAHGDNDLSGMNNLSTVKPNRKNPAFDVDIRKYESDLSGHQPYGAHVYGGVQQDDIAEIRYPWSKIEKQADNVDISDVNSEPISDKLERLGYTDEEIKYFYSINNENATSGINTSAMKQLRTYRKSKQVKEKYQKMGVPKVTFAHKHGMDMHSPRSYSTNPEDYGKEVEEILGGRISKEIDAELEQTLKKIRKTRSDLVGIKQ